MPPSQSVHQHRKTNHDSERGKVISEDKFQEWKLLILTKTKDYWCLSKCTVCKYNRVFETSKGTVAKLDLKKRRRKQCFNPKSVDFFQA